LACAALLCFSKFINFIIDLNFSIEFKLYTHLSKIINII
jgi:hypothetical protein